MIRNSGAVLIMEPTDAWIRTNSSHLISKQSGANINEVKGTSSFFPNLSFIVIMNLTKLQLTSVTIYELTKFYQHRLNFMFSQLQRGETYNST